ncbi:aminoglycoside phosphotransferase (APT) family kinase protein [Novosphingobium chloroacetimidivorans]|uniref:Aminoglycoside phosphotransferase (APT) family kinase protein n=1 Tax=Novosphingobium chloroacetimidivorans TaxID=1428314 RepID=A0A7W7KCB3_9SPHN|nr:phosphotransferase [Novosphingobium chloroacetimidivorans]MBB4860219.1 aminoglycoside phosphotransferase (APT) family kinase protein [Novosphingobium chloroacetimidivorans]
MPSQPLVTVPKTLVAALDPAWLSQALADVSGGKPVEAVEQVEFIRTVATKVRFKVTYQGGETGSYCIKGLLDVDEATARGGPTCVLEADFYCKVAPTVPELTVPVCVSAIIDREGQQAVYIMRDLVADGAQLGSALQPFTADEAVLSLAELAKLHASSGFLDGSAWIRPRAADLAGMTYITTETIQELLDGPRGVNLSPQVRNASRLRDAMKALAARDGKRPQYMIHGDAHAGNSYRVGEGGQRRAGLIDWQLLQRGGWALDIAYHLNAVLPTEVAEIEERRLLREYLAMARGRGLDMPEDEDAWAQYREAVIYGYYLWAITRRVDPAIMVQFTDRLGKAVTRHESHQLLGVA